MFFGLLNLQKNLYRNRRALKILYVTPNYKPSFVNIRKGGGEISNKILLDGLVDLGNEVLVLTLESFFYKNFYNDKFNIIQQFSKVKPNFFKLILSRVFFGWLLKKVLKKYNPDVVLCSTELVPITAKYTKKKFITGAIVRAYENFPKTNLTSKDNFRKMTAFFRSLTIGNIGKRELDNMDFIVTVSSFMKFKYQVEFPKLPIYIVYPPMTEVDYSISPVETIKKVMMVGVSNDKGIDVFLKIVNRFPFLEFVLIGDPKISVGVNIKDGNLTRYGWTQLNRNILKDIDLVLVPSQWDEPFGRISTEALLMGKLVLVSDKGGLPETVAYQEKLIVNSNDVDGWCSRIAEIIKNPVLFLKYQKIAQSNAKKFLADAQIIELQNIIRSIKMH